jgi:hypothetical protein
VFSIGRRIVLDSWTSFLIEDETFDSVLSEHGIERISSSNGADMFRESYAARRARTAVVRPLGVTVARALIGRLAGWHALQAPARYGRF